MRALDTNALVRILVRDDRAQAQRALELLEEAERRGERFLVVHLVVLELVWVLSAVYELGRSDVIDAIESLAQMPVLEFEDREVVQGMVRLGRAETADLPDLLIGLAARAAGADSTWTFERTLPRSGLFERIGRPAP